MGVQRVLGTHDECDHVYSNFGRSIQFVRHDSQQYRSSVSTYADLIEESQLEEPSVILWHRKY